jgi:hypothetical protein
MNLIEFKGEPGGGFYLRLRGSCRLLSYSSAILQPQLNHPTATGTDGHRPRHIHQGFSPLQSGNLANGSSIQLSMLVASRIVMGYALGA